MQTPGQHAYSIQTAVAPRSNRLFLSHQCYNKQLLNETVLFEGGPAVFGNDPGQCASWSLPSLNQGAPTTQQSTVIVPKPSVDRSDFLGKCRNPDFLHEISTFENASDESK